MLVVFSCGYNCSGYVDKHIESIRSQVFGDYKHIVVDDASTDDTGTKLDKYASEDRRVLCYHNETNKKWIPNALSYLTAEPDDIVVLVDMDDWLIDNNVLGTIDEYYKTHDVWVTYSKFMYLSTGKTSGWIPKYSQQIINAKLFRDSTWSFTHLRTFQMALFNKIKLGDLKRDKNKWFRCSYDQAIGLPILEMAAPDHIGFIDMVLYVYNDTNVLQVEKTNRQEQEETARYIRTLKRYSTWNR